MRVNVRPDKLAGFTLRDGRSPCEGILLPLSRACHGRFGEASFGLAPSAWPRAGASSLTAGLWRLSVGGAHHLEAVDDQAEFELELALFLGAGAGEVLR